MIEELSKGNEISYEDLLAGGNHIPNKTKKEEEEDSK